ncbi:hypothetical protein [Microcella humidisoli]|uniref:Lipoprotein n=1 Tax=Microcella humidisoli TaxID=2963406 RepID=A0ABY5FV86_9MICO|nr:hypothetical protein [Microcella humidisoli]UTT61847.1 hypothetical protein NNL39_09190 [Microcella humidisoli]
MTVRTASTGLIAALLLALAGCATPAPPAAETPVPTVTVTVTPSPEPELADYGFTYFRGGQLSAADFAEFSTQFGSTVTGLAECPWYAEVETHGADAATYAFTDPEGVDPGILFFYTQAFGEAMGDLPRNAEGVGVGSTQAEVLAAYPSAVVDAFDDVSVGPVTRITVDDPDSDASYVFGITDGSPVVNLLQWGTAAGGQWAHLCLPL